MSRLPAIVRCGACQQDVPTHQARRHISLWARAGKGGSLTGVAGLLTHDIWRCDRCIREMEAGGTGSLFEQGKTPTAVENGGGRGGQRASTSDDTR